MRGEVGQRELVEHPHPAQAHIGTALGDRGEIVGWLLVRVGCQQRRSHSLPRVSREHHLHSLFGDGLDPSHLPNMRISPGKRAEGALAVGGVGTPVVQSDLACSGRGQRIHDPFGVLLRHIDGQPEQLAGHSLQGADVLQTERLGQRVVHAVRCAVGVGVGVEHRDPGTYELLGKPSLVSRQPRHTP